MKTSLHNNDWMQNLLEEVYSSLRSKFKKLIPWRSIRILILGITAVSIYKQLIYLLIGLRRPLLPLPTPFSDIFDTPWGFIPLPSLVGPEIDSQAWVIAVAFILIGLAIGFKREHRALSFLFWSWLLIFMWQPWG